MQIFHAKYIYRHCILPTEYVQKEESRNIERICNCTINYAHILCTCIKQEESLLKREIYESEIQ